MARWKVWVLYISIFLGSFSNAERNRQPYRDEDQCPVDFPLGVGLNGINPGGALLPNSAFTSTEAQNDRRLAHMARLGDTAGAWTADMQNSKQWLSVDLGRRYIVTRVATQGRQGSDEFVTEYMLDFSDDQKTWQLYTNEFGITEMFEGNVDGNTQKRNSLKYPIVARYIRFKPQRWNMIISMRVEIYGCLFDQQVVRFGGDGYIGYDLSGMQGYNPTVNNDIYNPNIQNTQNNGNVGIKTLADTLKLRIRTNKPDGVIFYTDGNQKDYFVLELKRGYLYFHMDLGSISESPGNVTVIGGSMLDDNVWHDILILRNQTKVTVVVDRLETVVVSQAPFFRLDLDKKIYLGGVPTFNQNGLTTRFNFEGCMENVIFDGIHMIRDSKGRIARFEKMGTVDYNCMLSTPMPVTFPNFDSYIKKSGIAAGGPVRVRFEFRTHDEDGLLLQHELSDSGSIEVRLRYRGDFYKNVSASGQRIDDIVRNTDVTSIDQSFTDGLWHTFYMDVDNRKVNVTVDLNKKISNRAMVISAGSEYYIGGHDLQTGFRGCMRNIDLATTLIDLALLTADEIHNAQIGSCGIVDRCIPNPCEHEGKCTQNWGNFFCDCMDTGYKGEVCHISAHHLSCEMHKMYTINDNKEDVIIDLDGSGPLAPFTVGCMGQVDDNNPVETSISHDSKGLILVDGYQAPNFYKHSVTYSTGLAELTEFIERASTCQQSISYSCNNSRLLAPTTDSEFPHYGWWVGRTFQPMYYWGGAAPGSGSCKCGLDEKGCPGGASKCGCDSGVTTTDGGQLVHKDFLPVIELHFGDTGTVNDMKSGQYELGELKCQGDNLFDNVVTFRKADATLEFGTFEAENSGDIWFQFKTTARDGVMIHNTGPRDFIQVRILNGDTIQFSYDVGNGIQVLEHDTKSSLNNDQWQTVHVERNRKQSWMRINNFQEKIFTEPQDELIRLLDLTSKLIIGATVEGRNGFVGCMRGLRVNGVLMDMRGMVTRGEQTYGLSEGCVGKCASNPCFNGGTCQEGYSGYTCDCAYTPFRGWMCYREVGVNLKTNYLVKYTFDSTQGLSATDFMFMSVGFTTKRKQGILMQLQSADNSEYISLEMNNNGGVKFVVDISTTQRWELNTPNEVNIDYANGQQHVAIMRRENNGQTVILQVDDYKAATGTLGAAMSDNILDSPKYLFVGNNDTTNTNRGFEGCIYRMQIDNVYPLKRAFQDPPPSFVELIPKGEVREDMCGFEEITRKPDENEVRPIGGLYINVTYPKENDEEQKAMEGIIIGVVVGIIFLCLLVALIILCLYFRQKGDYETQEAKGTELADNPDTAIVFNQTGLQEISKKKEWFI
ncbi:hypothetical protein ScPMuIL_012025 [Solemya velum]